MQFFIIDDKENDLTYLRHTITAAFPESKVLPEGGKVFKTWSSASEYLRRHVPSTEDVVLMMDIALGDGDRDVLVPEGIHRCETLRGEFPNATMIACTQYDRSVRDHPSFGTVFHGLFEKQEWDRFPTLKEKARYALEVIQQALPKDISAIELLFERTKIEDSLGVRTFESVFGVGVLKELVFHFVAGCDDVALRALSGGLSGAFLFEILATGPQGRSAIIVKVARDRSLIDNEVSALERHYGSLGPLTPHILRPQSQVVEHFRNGGHYLEQAAIPGEDLLRLATRDFQAAAPEIRRFLHLLVSCVKDLQDRAGATLGRLGDFFQFKPLDFSRLRASAEFLRTLGPELERQGLWPKGTPPPAVISERIIQSGELWRDGKWKVLDQVVPVMVQHGDVHIANVLLTRNGQQVLVDIARIGVWPVGYDISRLAIQMRLRLPDRSGAADYLPTNLHFWLSQDPSGEHDEGASPACVLADECDVAFAGAISNSEHETAMRLAYLCGTVWDLMKIASYGDISTFKRIWAMVTLHRLFGHVRFNL